MKNIYLTCHCTDGGGSEFEGLKGGFRMMSLLTLFGGLKNVFRVKSYTTDTVIFRLHYKVTFYSSASKSCIQRFVITEKARDAIIIRDGRL